MNDLGMTYQLRFRVDGLGPRYCTPLPVTINPLPFCNTSQDWGEIRWFKAVWGVLLGEGDYLRLSVLARR